MQLPTLHVLGLFHTILDERYTHCAFSQKVFKFSRMMQPFGWNVVEYSNGESKSEANEKVQILTEEELDRLSGKHEKTAFHGNTAWIGSPHWCEFDKRLKVELKKRVKPGDFIIHSFGRAHASLVKEFPEQSHVEGTGIGYPDRPFGAFRIYESYAWQAYHQGKELFFDDKGGVMMKDGLPIVGRGVSDYEWVVPNYFIKEDWDISLTPKQAPNDYILYMGRICKEKGWDIIHEIAKKCPIKIVSAGQGDITSWKHPNIEYIGPVFGRERSPLIGGAKAMLMPTRFVEPFGGSGVEAQFCGTPLISCDAGAFAETVEHGKTGYRCHTLSDYLEAINRAPSLDRSYIADRARRLYSLEACGARYDAILKTILDLYGNGWYSEQHHLLP